MGKQWYIFRVRSGHEVAAARESGEYAYVPRVQVKTYDRRMRVTKTRVAVMLPGYVFIRCADPRFVALPRREAYIGFMRNGDRSYAVLTDRAFSVLVGVENEIAKCPDVPEIDKTPAIGDAIEVYKLRGKAAVRALVQEIRGNTVLAELVGSSMRVIVPVDEVRAA